jgi:hypothetical protein
MFNSSDRSGFVVGNPLAEQLDDVAKIKFLNFTHRAAHGGNDDADVAHGKMSKLAVSELNKLKNRYPNVFSDP